MKDLDLNVSVDEDLRNDVIKLNADYHPGKVKIYTPEEIAEYVKQQESKSKN